jgi:hypothetical protein
MMLHVVRYWDIDDIGDLVEKREFFRGLFEAIDRRELLIHEKDGPTADFFMDKVLYTMEYSNTDELVTQLNLLNSYEGRKILTI